MPAMAPARSLHFETFDDLLAEIDRLESGGYHAAGRWNLGQICDHLNFYLRGTLDGFDFRLPWIVRVLLGPPLRRKMLSRKAIAPGSPTIPASRPDPSRNEAESIAATRELVRRFRDHDGPLRPSPLLGELTPEQWRTLHLHHAAHHLSFLVPSTGRPD